MTDTTSPTPSEALALISWLTDFANADLDERLGEG